ncbi:hypothetical protein F5051DRAFT_445596 [Lentinula edodes]|nr:hypothetical protein F5051DRAFT_445596 [Lentinula edodes]
MSRQLFLLILGGIAGRSPQINKSVLNIENPGPLHPQSKTFPPNFFVLFRPLNLLHFRSLDMLLPRISTSSLFTLFYLWTNFLTVLPLPLPTGDNNAGNIDNAVPVFFGPPQPPIYIQIAIANKDTPRIPPKNTHSSPSATHSFAPYIRPTPTTPS